MTGSTVSETVAKYWIRVDGYRRGWNWLVRCGRPAGPPALRRPSIGRGQDSEIGKATWWSIPSPSSRTGLLPEIELRMGNALGDRRCSARAGFNTER
jgi:hypothetical protein